MRLEGFSVRQGELRGSVALVTGAGSGIGRAIAVLFACEAAKVAVADVSEGDGKNTVELIKKEGGDAIFVQGDVSKSTSVKRMVEATVEKYGKLNVLVNNAGVESTGSVVEVTEENWDKVIDINLKGTFLCSKYCAPRIIESGGGAIINIASVLGLVGSKGEAAYCASKGGMISLTRAMALDFASENVRVNCICPGSVLTPTFKRVMIASGDYDIAFARNLEKIPLRRVAAPEEIAQAALFLASEKSSYMTGAALVMDGGWSTS
ncbi:MAG: SDR family NAD(P)-dependent oxidoreductase [Candidatus Bathyarchaeia archaeon]|jgi:NAD(P)-dependent dehydrogenase (short-subunit alcohol dehydrogenase family)